LFYDFEVRADTNLVCGVIFFPRPADVLVAVEIWERFSQELTSREVFENPKFPTWPSHYRIVQILNNHA